MLQNGTLTVVQKRCIFLNRCAGDADYLSNKKGIPVTISIRNRLKRIASLSLAAVFLTGWAGDLYAQKRFPLPIRNDKKPPVSVDTNGESPRPVADDSPINPRKKKYEPKRQSGKAPPAKLPAKKQPVKRKPYRGR